MKTNGSEHRFSRILVWLLAGSLSATMLASCAAHALNEGDVQEALSSQVTAGSLQDDGTAQRKTSYSRVHLFTSLEEMGDDSEEVVTVTVRFQEEVFDIDGSTPFVLTYVTVEEGHKGALKAGDEIVVRQTGFAEESLLENGSSYLLYLVSSGLDGELASHYYINGVTAGIYQLDVAVASFRSAKQEEFQRVDEESGDNLPSEVSLDEIRAGI